MIQNIISKLGKTLALLALISGSVLHGAGLKYLASHANAIVMGSVDTRIEGPTQVSFTLNVDKIFSGSVTGSSLSVVHPWTGIVRKNDQVQQTLYGIWFLTNSPSQGIWDVLTARPLAVHTVFGLFLPAPVSTPSTGPYAYPQGTSLLDELAYQVAAGVQAANEDPEIILGALESLDTPAVRSILNTCSASSRPAFQAVGFAGKLERNVPETVEQLSRSWPNIKDNPLTRDIASALKTSWRDSTPAGAQALVSLATLTSANDRVRQAAVWAIAAIHSKDTLPFLESLLSSSNSYEQAEGIYGLAAFANGCPMRTADNVVTMSYLKCDQPSSYKTPDTGNNFAFRPGTPEQQTPLVAFWQKWWASHPELH